MNDVERVQFAMSNVFADLLQQFFTFLFTIVVVVLLGGKLAWLLLLFVPFIIFSSGKIGRRARHTTRRGQDKLADIQNVLHETITGNRVVKAFSMEAWELVRFRKAARRLFRANLRSVARRLDQFSANGYSRSSRTRPPSAVGTRASGSRRDETGNLYCFYHRDVKLYDPVRKFALFYNNFQQALGASSEIFKFMDVTDEVQEKPNAPALPPFSKASPSGVSFGY